MAEIDIQRKRRSSTWPVWLLGLLLVGLLLWWVWPKGPSVASNEMPTRVEPGAMPPPGAVGAAQGIPVVQILADPTAWVGRSLDGEVRVTEVVGPHGFWIQDQGEQLFVLIDPMGGEPPTVEPNTLVRLTGATVRDATVIAQFTRQLPDKQVTTVLESQQVFLVVEPGNIQTTSGPTTGGPTTSGPTG